MDQFRRTNSSDPDWEQLVNETFDHPTMPAPAVVENDPTPVEQTVVQESAQKSKKRLWFALVAALILVGLVCILLTLPEAKTPSQAEDNIPEELLICKEALDKWQALDSYMIFRVSYTYNNYSDPAQQTIRYWVNGEDWMYLNYSLNGLLSSQPAGYMCRGGKYYLTSSSSYSTWQPYGAGPEYILPKIWPMDLSLDDCRLVYVNTVQSSGQTDIHFAVIDSSEETTAVYDVSFRFIDGDDTPVNITVIQTLQDSITKDMYTLISVDAEAIAQQIAEQPLEKIYTDVTPD